MILAGDVGQSGKGGLEVEGKEKGRRGWIRITMGTERRYIRSSRSSSHQILTPFLDLIPCSESKQSCICCCGSPLCHGGEYAEEPSRTTPLSGYNISCLTSAQRKGERETRREWVIIVFFKIWLNLVPGLKIRKSIAEVAELE